MTDILGTNHSADVAGVEAVPVAAPTHPEIGVRGYELDLDDPDVKLSLLACALANPDTMHPARGDVEAEQQALAFCGKCATQLSVHCLYSGVEQGKQHGVYGGTTEQMREEMFPDYLSNSASLDSDESQ